MAGIAILLLLFFFFNDTATTEIYTLSLHDALPIFHFGMQGHSEHAVAEIDQAGDGDRKSTRLNSSHQIISYAVFCLKKKKNKYYDIKINKKKNIKYSLDSNYEKL